MMGATWNEGMKTCRISDERRVGVKMMAATCSEAKKTCRISGDGAVKNT